MKGRRSKPTDDNSWRAIKPEKVSADDAVFIVADKMKYVDHICFPDAGDLSVGDRFELTNKGKQYTGVVEKIADGKVYAKCDTVVAVLIRTVKQELPNAKAVIYDPKEQMWVDEKENKDGEQTDT